MFNIHKNDTLPLNVEIGPGIYPLDGFVKLDCAAGEGRYNFLWGVDRMPFDDNTVDLIYASHVLEHVAWYQTVDALKEAHRVLKPGKSIEVWVPDFQYIVLCYRDGKCGDEWRRHNADGYYMNWVNGRVFAYGSQENWHRALFDRNSLRGCLFDAGFKEVRWLDKPRGYDHGPINLGMEGIK